MTYGDDVKVIIVDDDIDTISRKPRPILR